MKCSISLWFPNHKPICWFFPFQESKYLSRRLGEVVEAGEGSCCGYEMSIPLDKALHISKLIEVGEYNVPHRMDVVGVKEINSRSSQVSAQKEPRHILTLLSNDSHPPLSCTINLFPWYSKEFLFSFLCFFQL